MAKQKSNTPKRAGAPVTSTATRTRQEPSAASPNPAAAHAVPAKYANLIWMAAIAIAVFLFLRICLQNQITNWDDPGYFKDNLLVKDLTAQGIKNIFSTAVMGNYHPLTILSYAWEYSVARLDPYIYHRDSLLLHIGVTLSVFWWVWLLSGKRLAAGVAALLFGLHPMHMESVAWIAARKDVLYGLFYVWSCICYVYYLRVGASKRKVFYLLAFVAFISSILSKPTAVVLPLVLLLTDYFEGRKLFPGSPDRSGAPEAYKQFSLNVYLEKIPFFLVSLAAGIKSLMDQHDFKALDTMDVHFNALERLSLGAYALVTYLWKAVLPAGLSNFYPYPEQVHGGLPLVYYVFPAIVAALAFAFVKYGRKNLTVFFSGLFFLVNIILLLQFLQVGGAIIADRYSYIPYIGLFFGAGVGLQNLYESEKFKNLGKPAVAAAGLYLCVLGWQSNERCAVWCDAVSLWRDEVVKHPDVPQAFNNLGFEYFTRGNNTADPKVRNIYFDSAAVLLQEAIRLQPNFANPYISLGEVYRTRENFPAAKQLYYKAVSLNNSDETQNAYLGLAIIYCITGQQMASHGMNGQPMFDSAHYCFHAAIEQHPFFPEAHGNYGNFFDMMGQFDSSLREYSLAIDQNPDMYAPYLNRARLLQRHNHNDDALKDFDRAAAVSPETGEIYYSRSFCYMQKGDKQHALQDVQKAISLGFSQVDPNYYHALGGK